MTLIAGGKAMIRIKAAVLWVMMITPPAFAGPFGIEQGMQKNQLKIVRGSGDFKYQIQPPKQHPDFKIYRVTLHPSTGVCRLFVMGKTISANAYGEQLRSQFNKIKGQLEQTYGKNKVHDYLKTGSMWKEPQEWMQSLNQGERVLSAFWDKEAGSSMKDNIKQIGLHVMSLDTSSALSLVNDKGYLGLMYTFRNDDDCQQAIEKDQSSTF